MKDKMSKRMITTTTVKITPDTPTVGDNPLIRGMQSILGIIKKIGVLLYRGFIYLYTKGPLS
jgi:hypothetical protein